MDEIKSYQSQYYDITNKLTKNPHKIGDSRIGKINSRFCEQIRIDLSMEFPIMDIKWIKFSNIVHELLWMIRGDTNAKYLIENQCGIWTDDAYRYYKEKYAKYDEKNPNLSKEDFIKKVLNSEEILIPKSKYYEIYDYGDLDRIYGHSWRKFNGKTDQMSDVIETLKNNPDDRRMIVIGHNPTDLKEKEVGLPSCHNYMQFYTTINEDNSRTLNTFCNIRSNDWFLGNPYNVPQYALLTHIIAKLVNMNVGELVINAVDCHLYHEHFNSAKEWIKRYDNVVNNIQLGDLPYYGSKSDIINNHTFCKSKLKIHGNQTTIDDFKSNDFELLNYIPQSYIKTKLLT